MRNFINKLRAFPPILLFSISALNAQWCDSASDCSRGRFDFQFRGIALKPSGNNLYYAAEAFPFNPAIATPIVSPRWAIYDLHPKYSFAFDLGLQYTCPERETTFGINWEHLRSRTRGCRTTTGKNMIGPLFSIGPDESPYMIARGCLKFNFDEVNIRFGQQIYSGPCDRLVADLFAGISYLHISQCFDSTYSDTTGTVSRTIAVPSAFKGAGPQVGVDFDYDICRRISFAGQVAAGIYVGHVKECTRFISRSPILDTLGDPNPNIQSTSTQKRLQIVPGIEERLGLAYTFRSWCSYFMMRVEAGYEAKVFFNALQSTDFSSGVIDVPIRASTAGVFARTFRRALSNFAVAGPYAAINFEF